MHVLYQLEVTAQDAGNPIGCHFERIRIVVSGDFCGKHFHQFIGAESTCMAGSCISGYMLICCF